MNKLVLISLVIPTLLVGCGSSSSKSSSVTTTFQWQIVQLKSVTELSLASKCIIYADSDINDEEVITAYVAEKGFNIIYHNEDGTIEHTFNADEFTDGLVDINNSDIPDNGYVTLEEVSDARGGDTGSYMFSVKKSLMSDLVLNISQEQNDTCYTLCDFLICNEY